MTEDFHFSNFTLKKATGATHKSKKILLSIGGRSASTAFFKSILPLFDRLYAVDKGLDIFCDTHTTPDFFVGDMDSARQESLDFLAKSKAEVIKLEREKDDTDFQAALKFALEKKKANSASGGISVSVLNAFGGRLDHLLSNIFTFSNIAPPFFPFFMGDESELLFFVKGKESLTFNFMEHPRNISLLSLNGTAQGVSLLGAKWNLHNATLEQGFPYAISNEVEHNTVSVTCEAGLLAFYILFSKENELDG